SRNPGVKDVVSAMTRRGKRVAFDAIAARRPFTALRFVALFFAAVAGAAETARLLILHTNDLHDHVRAGSNGVGGLPYISGYVKQVRAERADVLLLDAGDVTEKGDLVAFKTHSVMTYEAMRRMGYDGAAIGNHEYDAFGHA